MEKELIDPVSILEYENREPSESELAFCPIVNRYALLGPRLPGNHVRMFWIDGPMGYLHSSHVHRDWLP
jgi:hypothetical protein